MTKIDYGVMPSLKKMTGSAGTSIMRSISVIFVVRIRKNGKPLSANRCREAFSAAVEAGGSGLLIYLVCD